VSRKVARDVQCPTCHAEPGNRCTGSARVGYRSIQTPHPARVRAAAKASDTGVKVTVVPASAWTILPPPANVCQTCAKDHEPGQPHDPQTLYYQTAFRQKHGRRPTWADALAHCTPIVQAMWVEELAKHGIPVGES
jgi:hypothetical protein